MTVYEIALILHSSPKTITIYLNTDPNTVEDKKIAREKQLTIEQKQKDIN